MTEPAALQGDFLHQLLHVGDAAGRLLAMQDRDPLSPSFGSFHYAYWRDKTSEFGDARFQEAGAALGLLAHPAFRDLGVARGWPRPEVLLAAFHAGLINLQRLQYAEGCYDEWYKGERGFAATAFTTFAYASAALELTDQLPNQTADLLRETLAPAAHWLLARDDLVKVNHEVVAAAALAAYGRLAEDDLALAGARAKLRRSLDTQRPEGWFPELRGMDFGYSALVVDYLGHYGRRMGMETVADAAGRVVRFLLPHFHPDLTLAAEAGTCRNPYAGQAGYVLLAPHVEEAAALTHRLASLPASASRARIAAYLVDDLRLARWSILPVLGALVAADNPDLGRSLGLAPAQGWTVHPEAGVAAYHDAQLHVHFPFSGGAVTRVYAGDRLLLADLGIEAERDEARFTSLHHSGDRSAQLAPDLVAARFDLAQPGYLFPGFLQRLVLRLGSTFAWSSRWMRAGIDWYRQRKRTAINQSATAVGKGGPRFALERQVRITDGKVVITDTIAADGLRLHHRLESANGASTVAGRMPQNSPINVRKTIDPLTGSIEVGAP
jgi:hypothetical protein